MHSYLLSSMGIGGFDLGWLLITSIILFILVIVLFILLIKQSKKLNQLIETYNTFMEGKDGGSLESAFTEVFTDIRDLKKKQNSDRNDINELLNKIKGCYQKLGLVKYDAFREMGGKLSFSICLLDETDSGYIINSVHSNAGCYTYAKEIVNGNSALDLGDEEREALDQAISETNSQIKSEAIIKAASDKAAEIET